MPQTYRKLNKASGTVHFTSELENVEGDLGPYDVMISVKAAGISYIPPKTLEDISGKSNQDTFPASTEVAGVVYKTGADVSSIVVGDNVTGLIPLTSKSTGCSETCIVPEYNLVRIPDGVSNEMAAAVVGDGLKAYTALQYKARVERGMTLLVTDPTVSWCGLLMELAHHWDVKIFALSYTPEQKSQLQKLHPYIEHIIDAGEPNTVISNSVMEQTGGLGVDVVVDNGVSQFTTKDDRLSIGEQENENVPSKHDILSCLGVASTWVTSCHRLQLDPPDTESLFLRGSTVSFLFEHTWVMATAHHGKFKHILSDLLHQVHKGRVSPHISSVVYMDTVNNVLQDMDSHQMGKTVVVQPQLSRGY